jgi:signal transduction histidine kinase
MLRILSIDDDPMDVELINMTLHRTGREFILSHARDAAEISFGLRTSVDVVLCDFTMPSISAKRAVELVRQHSASLPVIVLSSSIGEEAVVELFRAGASDYLSKDKLALLPTIIERVLRAARRERARLAALTRMKQLSRRLIETEDRERAALARDLHDNLGQLLTGMMLRIENVRAGSESWERLTELVQHAVREVKTMSFALRPTQLDILGLVPAAQALLSNQFQGTRLRVQVLRRGCATASSAAAQVLALRVLQEAATNVARHAHATRLVVKIHFIDAHALAICIADDGVGFDAVAVLGEGIRPENQGLYGMIERVELAGGRLRIRAAPGRGTVLRLVMGSQSSRELA